MSVVIMSSLISPTLHSKHVQVGKSAHLLTKEPNANKLNSLSILIVRSLASLHTLPSSWDHLLVCMTFITAPSTTLSLFGLSLLFVFYFRKISCEFQTVLRNRQRFVCWLFLVQTGSSFGQRINQLCCKKGHSFLLRKVQFSR